MISLRTLLNPHLMLILKLNNYKSAQSGGNAKGVLGIGNQNNGVFNFVELPLITINVKLPGTHGNEADVGIRFTQERSELTDLLSDARRENHTVGL